MNKFQKIYWSFICILCLTISQNLKAETAHIEEDNTLPIVYLNLVLDSGSANDPQNKNGLTNLANQMLLRGTQLRSKNDFYRELNHLGGQIEIETRNEGSILRGAVLSENIDAFLMLFAEAILKPKFTSEELRKLKKEIEGEILEQKGSDKALVQYHYNRFLYGEHPYGYPILGTIHGLKNIDHSDILNHYNHNLTASSLHLFVTGAVKKDIIQNWFNDVLEKISAIHPSSFAQQNNLNKIIEKPTIEPGRRALLVHKAKTTQTQILLGGAGMRPETDGFYDVLLANHSFGGHSFQARMMQEIRVKRGWTYGAANSFRFGRHNKHFGMYVFPKNSDTIPSVELMVQLFEDFVKNGITPEEFKFAKDSLVNNAPFNFDTSKKRLENRTTEFLLNFPEDYNKKLASEISKVRFENIKPALQNVFHPENLALTIVGDANVLQKPLSKTKLFNKIQRKDFMND